VFLLQVQKYREPTSGLEPLTCSTYECAVRRCRGLYRLAIAAYQRGFLSLPCCVLHRITFPVVSEWYQQRHSSFTILLTRARIRSTLSTPPTDQLILDH
jgi:hypothetical protein